MHEHEYPSERFFTYIGGLSAFAGAASCYFIDHWLPLHPWANPCDPTWFNLFDHPVMELVTTLAIFAGVGPTFFLIFAGCLIGMWWNGLRQPRIPIRGSLILAGAAALMLAHGPLVPATWGVLWVSADRGFYLALLAGGAGNVLLGLLARLLMPRTAPVAGHFVHHAASALRAVPPAPARVSSSVRLAAPPDPPPLRLPGRR